MFACTITEANTIKCIAAEGRIDALSSADIQKVFDELILAGERTLLVDMTSVNYVSSAGLRIFIFTQKELKKVGGEILLLGMAPSVAEVFRMSGLTGLFRIIRERGEIDALLDKGAAGRNVVTREVAGVLLEYAESAPQRGSLFVIGSPDKTETSSYGEKDVVPVKAAAIQSGCGFATLGEAYEEYKTFFGEAMVVNGSFFFYPAVPYPSVDFLINARRDSGLTYKFLHGFGFNGPYRYVLSFQRKEQSVGLTSLIDAFFRISRADVLGITMIAETEGFWGMHVKKVPLGEQKPINGKSIFDSDNFSDWIDFPVEASFAKHITLATGIAVRDRRSLSPEWRALVSEESNFHIHGGIFEKAPLGKNIGDFDKEVLRICDELRVYKVQHVLGRTRFSGGMAAIVELEV